MRRNIEILAPAGSFEGMKAAMNAGADAVYIGGSSFGARAYADNPDEDTLLQAIDEAHIRGKKLYLTVNTLLKEKERTGELYSFLERYYFQGLDAVIVQDVGVMHFIHEHFPDLPIHASTQTTLTMAQGANLLKGYGVTRLVTARELSLKEIKTIRENTDLEIETFVHGALCYCYSGQCLMSSMIGGRSGNRGRCAQPCRMPYQFHSDNRKLSSEQEKYLLSPKDINTISIIPELVEAGIDSFKIEGRMKRPEYAAAVAFLYRKYVDLYLERGKEGYNNLLEGNEFETDMILLQDVYNRGGFSEGYGKTYNGKKMMSMVRPNHSGVEVGEVTEVKGSQVGITLTRRVNAQDILEIRNTEEDGYEFTVKDPHDKGEILRTNVGRRPLPIAQETKSRNNQSQRLPDPVMRIGASVYRTKNNELLEILAKEYIAKDRKQGIKGILKAHKGEKLSLTLSYEDYVVTAYQEIVQEALKQPMTKEKLSVPIEKTGDTFYFFKELVVEADENIFVPVAWLNEIRREAISLLVDQVAESFRRKASSIKLASIKVASIKATSVNSAPINTSSNNKHSQDPIATFEMDAINNERMEITGNFGISVSLQTREQFDAVIHLPEISAIYADYDTFTISEILGMAQITMEAGKNFYLSLPHICRLAIYDRLKKDLLEIIKMEAVSGFIVKNFEEIELLKSLWIKESPKKEIILNYNMYIYNKEAKAFWNEKGITNFTAPVELNYQELRTLGTEDCDMIVYGYLPLMVSAQCLIESTQGCKKRESGHDGYLTDRLGKNFFVQTNCKSCINIIYNGQALALHKQYNDIIGLKPRNIRLDFCTETAAQIKQIMTVFIERYRYGKPNTEELSDYTTGHFKRGVE